MQDMVVIGVAFAGLCLKIRRIIKDIPLHEVAEQNRRDGTGVKVKVLELAETAHWNK
jgi:hypothetical protein